MIERRQSKSSPAQRNRKRCTYNMEEEEVRDNADSSGIVTITGTVRDVNHAMTVLQKQQQQQINPEEYKRLRREKKQLQLLRHLSREEMEQQQYQQPTSHVLKRIQYSEEMMINQQQWQHEQLQLQDTIQQQSHKQEQELTSPYLYNPRH